MKDKGKENFYSDLDDSREQKGKKNSCSFLSLAIFFIIIFLIAEFSLYYIAKGFRSNNQDSNAITASNQLDMRGSGIDLGENRFALSVSQGILCSLIEKYANINSLACAINPSGIELTGKLSAFLPSNTKVILTPSVRSGKIEFKVKKAAVGFVTVPSFFVNYLSDLLNSALYQTFPDLEKAQVDKVELQEAVMTITAKKI